MCMKTHHIIDCECLEKIQEEALVWIKDHTDLLEKADQFWNKIDYKQFLLQNPTLVKWSLENKWAIREVAVLVAHEESGVGLHTDEKPVICKLNIPIQNTKDTYTEWYNGDQLLDRVETTSPMFFNSDIPHKVVIGDNAKLPRVQISCMFFKEPIHYLED